MQYDISDFTSCVNDETRRDSGALLYKIKFINKIIKYSRNALKMGFFCLVRAVWVCIKKYNFLRKLTANDDNN